MNLSEKLDFNSSLFDASWVAFRLFILALMALAYSPGVAYASEIASVSYEVPELWPYHATLMVIGFALLISGMMVARTKRSGWLIKHKALMVSGAAFAVAGLMMALYMVSATSEEHFNVPHAYLGALVILLLLLNPVLGFAQFRVADKRDTIRNLHRWVGRLALLLMAINMAFGFGIALAA